MTPMQQWLRKQLGIVLRCATDEEYLQKKNTLIAQLRRDHPQRFAVEGDTKRAFEQQAEEEGITLDEKLEELALMDYASHHRAALLRAVPPPDEKTAAALAALGLNAGDLNQIAEILDEEDPFV